MKKILKSILIATASIGTIAGSVATVVSCGSTTDDGSKKTPQENYQDALTAVVKHFKENALFTIELTTQVDAIKQQIQQNIYNFIKSTGTDKLTDEQLSAINLPESSSASNIQITNFLGFASPAVTPTTGQTIDGHNTNLTISIPAAAGITQGNISCVGVKYIVNAPATPVDQSKYHTEASTFTTSLINLTQQLGKAVEIQSLWTTKSVKDSILNYINDYMNTNYDPMYIAELKLTDLTMENNSIVQTFTGNPVVATGISVNIPPKAGVSANFERFDLNFTYVILETPDNPQVTFDAALNAATSAFTRDLLFYVSSVTRSDEIISEIKENLKIQLLQTTPTNKYIFDFSSLEVQITGQIPLPAPDAHYATLTLPAGVTISFHINSGTKNINSPSSQTALSANTQYSAESNLNYYSSFVHKYTEIYFHKNPIFRATAAEMADPQLTSVQTQIITNYKNYLKTLPSDWINQSEIDASSIRGVLFTNKTTGIYFCDKVFGERTNEILINNDTGYFSCLNYKFVIT